jgi:S-DNA-T family DNA segregation ATPase FtsK/SpoIIIE
LAEPPFGTNKIDEREITRHARLVEQKLAEFDVLGQVVEVKPGPAVTMYEFRPAASIKINDITKLADDLSLALSAESLRIIAPIPGRDVVGIETSNSRREPIFMRELVECSDFWSEDLKLPIALGKSISGESKIVDLRRIPHLLICGTTGSGKSVFTMSLVTSLIMRHSPKTLRLILVDPKQVDLAAFHKIPHLLLPPVKDAKPAINTLKWLIREMEKRYRSMSKFGAKNIEGYNEAIAKLEKSEVAEHEEKIRLLEENPQTALQGYHVKALPYIVAVIEEFADLMSVDRAGVEPAVVRLAQMARASGIHLVIAMQSPRREVLTGLIKTNFPGRISFKVASKVDSSVVLDQRGAERLLSVGDMLYLAPGVPQPQRYHGAFLKDEEMSAVTDFWINQGEPQFEESAVTSMEADGEDTSLDPMRMGPESEENYDEVVSFVASQKEVSASLLQRRFRFGYPKAARLIEIMENEGVVGPANGSKPRQVLLNKLD